MSATMQPRRPPNSWLVPAVVLTLCCMPLLGIPALYYAAQVSLAWRKGDASLAYMFARRARMFVLLGAVLYLVAVLVGTWTGATFDLLNLVRA